MTPLCAAWFSQVLQRFPGKLLRLARLPRCRLRAASGGGCLEVGNRAMDKINLVHYSGQLLYLARGKIVEHCNLVTAPDGLVHRIRPDKSGTARLPGNTFR